jgi:hypothetical protein
MTTVNSKRPTLTLGKKRSDPNAPKLTVTLNKPKVEVIARPSYPKKIKPEPLPIGVSGKMEINIKFNQLPHNVLVVRNQWRQFSVQVDEQQIRIRIRPRSWNKMLQAAEKWEKWTASVSGKMGNPIKGGFELAYPSVQIYEKKDKDSEQN